MTSSSKMALQMLVALALAFAIGMPLFHEHWAWVVLSAFIVCSGAIGRGDAIYKGALRVAGAIAGTFAAAAMNRIGLPGGTTAGIIIFAVLFLGMWLRQINYAYWAACATVIFALLQGTGGAPPFSLFVLRVGCIVIGALCAIAATWFVFPIRTEQVVRRRVADALAAMRDVVKGEAEHDLDHHVAQLDRIAPSALRHRTLIRDTRKLLAHVQSGGDRKHAGAELRRLGGLLRERPRMRVYVSVAVSIDGYIDDESSERLVLSSPEDLSDVRAVREGYDAVLVGAQTVRRDDPSLRSARVRVTITQSGELNPSLRFFDGTTRTIVLAPRSRVESLRSALGAAVEVVAVDAFEPAAIVTALQDCGIRSLFVEGGTRVLTAFLSSGTFDRLRVAVAPFFVGDPQAPRLVNAARFLNDARRRLALHSVRALGDVAVLEYEHPAG